jgi:hypothetical protein
LNVASAVSASVRMASYRVAYTEEAAVQKGHSVPSSYRG